MIDGGNRAIIGTLGNEAKIEAQFDKIAAPPWFHVSMNTNHPLGGDGYLCYYYWMTETKTMRVKKMR